MDLIENNAQRLDRWLHHARFYKTRTLAVDAIRNGRIEVNGERAKPSKLVHPGDSLRLRLPPYEYEIVIAGLAKQRQGAPLARQLYSETAASAAARLALAETLKLNRIVEDPRSGKLDKHERRAREQFKRTLD